MDLEARIRGIVDDWPRTSSKISHGRPTWFVGGKSFLVLHPDGHHQNTFPHLWVAAPPGTQEELVTAFPERFFRPPYVGHRGWVGLRLGAGDDWDEIGRLCRAGWETISGR